MEGRQEQRTSEQSGPASEAAALAAQSEKKTATVCDQPLGLDELAGHIEAPTMEACGSHSQAEMMLDPWATYKPMCLKTRAPWRSQEGSVKLDPGLPHETWRREVWLTKLWNFT